MARALLSCALGAIVVLSIVSETPRLWLLVLVALIMLSFSIDSRGRAARADGVQPEREVAHRASDILDVLAHWTAVREVDLKRLASAADPIERELFLALASATGLQHFTSLHTLALQWITTDGLVQRGRRSENHSRVRAQLAFEFARHTGRICDEALATAEQEALERPSPREQAEAYEALEERLSALLPRHPEVACCPGFQVHSARILGEIEHRLQLIGSKPVA